MGTPFFLLAPRTEHRFDALKPRGNLWIILINTMSQWGFHSLRYTNYRTHLHNTIHFVSSNTKYPTKQWKGPPSAVVRRDSSPPLLTSSATSQAGPGSALGEMISTGYGPKFGHPRGRTMHWWTMFALLGTLRNISKHNHK